MSEILKAAFARPCAINQNKNHFLVNKGRIPKYIWDFYPLAEDYYHEFNPYFVHLLYDEKLIPEFPVFTVRDGVVPFADFILKNMKDISSWKNLFLIPPEYTPLIPQNLRQQFLSYSISQVQKQDIRKAKVIYIFLLGCEQYYGSFEKIKEKLSVLKDVPADTKINVCMAPRRNPFESEERENLKFIHIPEIIRKALPNRDINWIRLRDLMEKSFFRDQYLIDLMDGNTLTCDSYLHFWFLSRGGTVHSVPEWDRKENIFDLDLSFHHKLHVKPLPEVSSGIADLVFFSKMYKGDYIFSPDFHEEVKKVISN